MVQPPAGAAATVTRRFEAGRRIRLRTAIVLGAILVVLVALSDALANQLFEPGERVGSVVLDVFISVVAVAIALSRRLWRPAPELAGLALGYLVVNNTLLTMVVTPPSFGLALAYLSMTIVAAAILLPWGRRSHAAFLAGSFLLTLAYAAAINLLGVRVELRDLFVAVLGALLVSAVTHEVLLRMALAEHGQRLRVRASHAALSRNSEALREREAQLAEAQAIGRIGSWEWNVETGIVTWSDEQRRILGVGPDLVPSYEAYLALVHPDDRAIAEQLIEAGFRSGSFQGDVRIVTPDGAIRWMHVRGVTHRDVAGHPLRLTGVSQDITDRKRTEADLERLALHDSLTGLPNRTLFRDRLERATVVGRSHDGAGRGPAVAFLDLDDFKVVNDTVGHLAGDELLRIAATRLASAARPQDTVARLGGDEFGILLLDVDAAAAHAVCERLLAALAGSVELAAREFLVSASIGVVAASVPGASADALLRHADVAMYVAKANGKGRVVAFEPHMAEGVRERTALKEELRRALAGDELFLLYQPQYELRTGSVVGVEALVRWRHPQRGVLPPDMFVPLAEASGLIVDLDRWVVRAACAQLAAWLSAGLGPIRMSVNASVRSIEQPAFLAHVQATIAALSLPPDLIELEITESQLADDGRQSARAVAALRAMGVRIAIDDFGTGYSVLARLKDLTFDTLKIDRRFVSEVESPTENHPLLQAMLGIARALEVKAIAEGIETPAHLEYLRAHGCDEGQGYLFSRPVEAHEIARLLVPVAA